MLITRFGIKVKIVLRLKCKPDRILARRRKDEHNKRKQDSSGAEALTTFTFSAARLKAMP